MHASIAPGWEHLADLIAKRFPWLEDDPDDLESDDEDEVSTVNAGTATFIGHGDRWLAVGEDHGDPHAGRRAPADPLWILEALTTATATCYLADPVTPGPQERALVRGAPCLRVRFRLDLRSAAAMLEGRQMAGMSERVTGEVWIDEQSRIRRVTWQRPIKRRPRSPIKLPAFTMWRTVELWDFGTHVDIEIPTPMPDQNPSLREIFAGLTALWQRKRAWQRAGRP